MPLPPTRPLLTTCHRETIIQRPSNLTVEIDMVNDTHEAMHRLMTDERMLEAGRWQKADKRASEKMSQDWAASDAGQVGVVAARVPEMRHIALKGGAVFRPEMRDGLPSRKMGRFSAPRHAPSSGS